ncbi:aminobutyraldehyde dehydrogenase [Rhodococcus opacus]|uniref:aminobutyraldehyde dehydrogenase n=1 Tax=Rhodococcus opacus TaxID=37919 RepID=UPI00155AB4D7|nr:aminobutyraldehyde dehydrogenase [Rhodococcus opacus]
MTTVSYETRHLINGEWINDAAKTIPVINPSTGETLADVGVASSDTVAHAVTAAHAAFHQWRHTTPKERSEILLALADLVDDNADEFARIESLNVGKPLANAREEIPVCSDVLRYFAGALRALPGHDSTEYIRERTSTVRREPIGVVGLITPWNYPLLEACWKIGPSLAAGNTLIIKPSEVTPLSTIRFADLAREHLPAGVLNVILGAGETGSALIEDSRVKLVSLTGDVGTGKKVAATAAGSLTRVHLELGGKAPVLVCDDVDVKQTARTLAASGFVNSGQDCTAPCRIIVHRNVYDEFVQAYLERAAVTTIGAPLDESVELGPVVSARQYERVRGFIDRARDARADVRVLGEVPRSGFYIAPTVVLDPAQDSEVVQNEVFGPVVTIQRADDDAHMVAMANDTRYGLASSIWTTDLKKSIRATRELEFGTVWVNEHFPTPSEMPFGGFGDSGYGKELSTHAIDGYSRFKHVMINTSDD